MKEIKMKISKFGEGKKQKRRKNTKPGQLTALPKNRPIPTAQIPSSETRLALQPLVHWHCSSLAETSLPEKGE
jgi:hypothetical protein